MIEIGCHDALVVPARRVSARGGERAVAIAEQDRDARRGGIAPFARSIRHGEVRMPVPVEVSQHHGERVPLAGITDTGLKGAVAVTKKDVNGFVICVVLAARD